MLKSSPLQVGLAQEMSYRKETLSGDKEAHSHTKWGDIFTLLPITKLLELNLHYSVGFPRRGAHQSTADELLIYSSG